MNQQPVLLLLSILAALAGCLAATERPNVVLIMTDDQGYGDLSCHGNPMLRTPNLDELYAESVRLTDFHVDPTCSPTRGALMSGKYAHRAKVWHTIAGGNHLRASEMTMADAFKTTGYRTGMFGKWHLGSNYPYRPMDRGFDEWLGQGDGGTGTTDDYFTNDRVNDVYLHNGEHKAIKGWAPDVFFDAAAEFIRERRTDQRPFFIYLNTYIPHSPHTLPDLSWPAEYEKKVGRGPAYFFAAIEHIDRNIGALRKVLAEERLAENTIVIFMTDNGGTAGVKVFNAGMRGHKGSPYDGGHRVPFFIHWPKGGLRHSADVASLNAHFDVLPTLIDLCRLTPPRKVDFDGRSFRQQLIDPSKRLPERTLFVERQRTFLPQKWNGAAGMTQRWRLVDGKELYDIQSDPGQRTNVIKDHPEVAERIRQAFEAYWTRVTPNDRARVKHIAGHPDDPETYLHPSDWYLPSVPWNHAQVAAGPKDVGNWRIRTARVETYRFEVRRWPREADAPIAGAPAFDDAVDAWDASGGKTSLIYAGARTKFVPLPAAFVRLRVGNMERVKPVGENAKAVTFDLQLEQADFEVTAELLDAERKVLAAGYYVYCRRLES